MENGPHHSSVLGRRIIFALSSWIAGNRDFVGEFRHRLQGAELTRCDVDGTDSGPSHTCFAFRFFLLQLS